MTQFAVIFIIFQGLICGYMWILISEKDDLLLENSSLKTTLESQKIQLNKEKLEYYENLQKAKDKTIDNFRLDKNSCETELKSYKDLINAM